jgi:NADH:ubiquinone reductase (H+-translocating)
VPDRSLRGIPCPDFDDTMSHDPKQVVILGDGFAGVYTARYLEKLLRSEEASITLINRENYWVYQPMLPEVISGSIGLTNVVSPIRRLCRRTNLIMQEVEGIDLERRIVTVSPGFRPRQLQLKYDYLVIALGSITDFHGMPGMIENAMPFRTLADAIVLRNHLIHVLEEADVEENPVLRRQLLTFVVGGGGFPATAILIAAGPASRTACWAVGGTCVPPTALIEAQSPRAQPCPRSL